MPRGEKYKKAERSIREIGPQIGLLLLSIGLAGGLSCGSNKEFRTSGSAEADRRAEQTVSDTKRGEKKTEATEGKLTLYDRLGGEKAIRAIVEDFLKRALEDPRVNWTRTGVTKGGLLRRDRPVEWKAVPENVNRLKEHFVQFISLAAGGPVKYDGKALKPTHADMQITRAEFDAAIGDLKATLDKLKVAADLQKELLAIFESTRPQIVIEK